MHPTLLAIGLFLIATVLTLLASGPRTWLLAIAQGLGVQAFIAGVVSAVQVGWILEGAADLPPAQRVTMAVEGIPFNAAGWVGRMIFEQMTNDQHPGAMSGLNDYLPIAGIQIALVALIIAWRKMQEESLCDVVQLFIMGLLITNTVCNVFWPWWGA